MDKPRFSLGTLVSCAMLTALGVVLNRFLSIHTAGWTIGFSFAPVALAAMVYGAAAGAAVGGLTDLIGAILFPFGPYFPGFTATAALMGAVYGWFLHRRAPLRASGEAEAYEPAARGALPPARFFLHVAPPALLNNLLLGLVVNTLWVSILYGSRTYAGWFIYRLPEYAILVPVNLLLLPVLLELAQRLRKYA